MSMSFGNASRQFYMFQMCIETVFVLLTIFKYFPSNLTEVQSTWTIADTLNSAGFHLEIILFFSFPHLTSAHTKAFRIFHRVFF